MIFKDTIPHQWAWRLWDFHPQDHWGAIVVHLPTLMFRRNRLLMGPVLRLKFEIPATKAQTRTVTQWTTPWWAIQECFPLWVWQSTRSQISPSIREIRTKSKIKLRNSLSSERGSETSETSTSWRKKANASTRRRWALVPIVRESSVRSVPLKAQVVLYN